MNKLYVYGTLRKGEGRTVELAGSMHDLGWFPGVHLDGQSSFVAESIEVDDDKLRQLDRYEGFYPDDPHGSLYIRQKYDDHWIYVYNQSMDGYPAVKSGDWLEYKEQLECA